MFPVEVVMQCHRWTKSKFLALQRPMQGVQTAETTCGKIIKCFAVSGGAQRLAPLEQRFGVHANGGPIQLSFAVNTVPAQRTLGRDDRAASILRWKYFVLPKLASCNCFKCKIKVVDQFDMRPSGVHSQSCYSWSSNASKMAMQDLWASGSSILTECSRRASPTMRVGWIRRMLAVSRSWKHRIQNC